MSSGGATRAAGVWQTWREAPVPVRAVIVGLMVNRLGTFVQVFLVLYLTHRGFSTTEAGIGLGVYGAGSVLGLLVGGGLTDRIGSRRTIVLSMAGSAALTLAVLYAPQYWAILAALALLGAVAQVYRPASANLLAEMVPDERQVMVFAMLRLAQNVGATVAPLFGTLLLTASYSLLFWGEAVAALVYAVIAHLTLPASATAKDDAPEDAAEQPSGGYLAVLGDGRYLLFLLAFLLNSLIYVQYLAVLPLAVKAAGHPTVVYGSLVALNGFIVIACELPLTKKTQNWPARAVGVAGLALLAGGLALYWVPLGIAALVLATVVWSLGEIVGGPTMFAYPAKAAPDGLRGRYLGSAHAMFGLGAALGPVAGVELWHAVGRPVWLWCGALGLVAVLAARAGMVEKSTIPRPIENKPSPDHSGNESTCVIRTGSDAPVAAEDNV
ncbi:MFS transporter [Actinomadura rupiterrae]|uniref:MFS transporter n=1 Tax=Actinomadura rupiterrae TaxID=559627 RepID=UPI0020A41C11|nr:MFS transporter [Actinomadura rupiterrae]MCP2337456.1 MFS family permease [Actinomadura rupiterrae]